MLVMYILWLANAYFGYKHWVKGIKKEYEHEIDDEKLILINWNYR